VTIDQFKYKRPFSPDESLEPALKTWQSPDLAPDVAEPAGKTNAFNKTIADFTKAQVHDVEAPEDIKPLTAEDIELIRQAAYEEGIAQGKEDGFSQGYSEGREQGYQDGLQQGLAEGKKTGLEQGEGLIQEQLAQLQQLIGQLQQPLSQVNDEVAAALVSLSQAMAQAVVGVEVMTNPQVILTTLRQAIDAMPYQAQHMQIRLHPSDLAVVQQHYSDEQLQQLQWQLQPMPTLHPGDIQVHCLDSSIDWRLSQRLQQSLEHFLQNS